MLFSDNIIFLRWFEMIFVLNLLHFLKSVLNAALNFVFAYFCWLGLYFLAMNNSFDFTSISVGFFASYLLLVIYKIYMAFKNRDVATMLSNFLQIFIFVIFSSSIYRSILGLGDGVFGSMVTMGIVTGVLFGVYVLYVFFLKKYIGYVYNNLPEAFGYMCSVDYEDDDILNNVYTLEGINMFMIRYVDKDVE